MKKIKSALISVFDKNLLKEILPKLKNLNIQIYSTGGTQKYLTDNGIKSISVENITSYPSILNGRVKTLHPKVFGGILAQRELISDINELKKYDIPELDLVIVDLYPFEQALKNNESESNIIENIDIGGISLIRAAAKNFKHTVVISSYKNLNKLNTIFDNQNGFSSIEDRKILAKEAFKISYTYDNMIFNYFSNQIDKVYKENSEIKKLRYGENPHQDAVFYGSLDKTIKQLSGKKLSYNNLLDIDSAINLIKEFEDPTFAIIKHNNVCGLSSRKKLKNAWKDALQADPISAFGGILITNTELDIDTANEIDKLFFEVIIAPSYNQKALNIISSKKNRIILINKIFPNEKRIRRTILNGIVEQSFDSKTDEESDLKNVTLKKITNDQKIDLLFASKICKHSKSNAIVIVKNKQLISSGVGQSSRVDALRHAIYKAKSFNFNLKETVMASDAFFPFPDCVEIGSNVGISAIIQPGGSINDKLSIESCDKKEIAMVFTGFRHFKH